MIGALKEQIEGTTWGIKNIVPDLDDKDPKHFSSEWQLSFDQCSNSDNPLKGSLVLTIRNLAWGIRARSFYFHRPYLLRNRDWCVKRKEKQRTHWLNNWASPKPSTGKSKERRETGKLAGRTLEGFWITSVKNNSTKVLQRRNHI